jgi:vacuolar-type H+-ATPase subunit H
LLTKGREFETRGRLEIQALRQELQRRESEPDEEKVQAQVYLQEFRALMTMSEQELYDFCTNARMNWPKIEAKAERTYAERLHQQARTANQPPEPDREALVEEATRGVSQFIQSSLANENWATSEVRDELATILSNPRLLSQFVYRTDRDIPEYGVRAGQWVADWDRAGELLADLQKPYQRAATATQAATQRVQTTQAVAQTNARALARAKPTTPPVAPKKTAPPRQRPQDVVKDAMAVWRDMNR